MQTNLYFCCPLDCAEAHIANQTNSAVELRVWVFCVNIMFPSTEKFTTVSSFNLLPQWRFQVYEKHILTCKKSISLFLLFKVTTRYLGYWLQLLEDKAGKRYAKMHWKIIGNWVIDRTWLLSNFAWFLMNLCFTLIAIL